MYAVVDQENFDLFLERRMQYLSTYNEIVYKGENDFGMPQIVAIYTDALHFDLYTVTEEMLSHNDPIKVVYDPEGLFKKYQPELKEMSVEQLAKIFNDTLYYFVEADSAYQRENYAWTARIMDSSIAGSAILLRYLYDKKYAFLGLKKLNQIVAKEEFELIEEAYRNLRKEGFQKSNTCILEVLDIVLKKLPDSITEQFNLKFYQWIKENVNHTLFVKR